VRADGHSGLRAVPEAFPLVLPMESGLSFCPAQLSLPMIISFLVATDLSKEVTCANLFCFDLDIPHHLLQLRNI
jgi:hypothetical protein